MHQNLWNAIRALARTILVYKVYHYSEQSKFSENVEPVVDTGACGGAGDIFP